MRTNWRPSVLILGAALIAVSGCATRSDLEPYATKGELSAMREELMVEIKKAKESARTAEESAAAAAISARQAAEDADAASRRAEAVFRKSLRK
jgi:hypothetical protein